MTCTQANRSTGQMSISLTPSYVASASLADIGRRLMVSDSPETLNAAVKNDDGTTWNGSGTLWHDAITAADAKTSQNHRVLVWHLNDWSGVNFALGLTIQNKSTTNTLKITSPKRQKSATTTTDLLGTGICLAKATLGGTLDSFSFQDSQLSTGAGSGVWIVNADSGLSRSLCYCCTYEFTVARASGTGYLDYELRFVCTNTNSIADLRNITSVPVQPQGGYSSPTHQRGTWKKAAINGTLPVFTITSTSSQVLLGITTSPTMGYPDYLYTKGSSDYDPSRDVGNWGDYAVEYNVTIPIQNNSGATRTVRVRTTPSVNSYGGAVRTGGTTYGVPALTKGGNPSVAHILDQSAPIGSSSVSFTVMHAGGASLPVWFLLTIV